MATLLPLALLLLILAGVGGKQQPILPDDLLSAPVPNAVPALPLAHSPSDTCHLDLSDELFGGVSAACTASPLDRGRCCPVLAAWLFAAHARTALAVPAADEASSDGVPDGADAPLVPYDNQQCVDALGAAMEKRGVQLPRLNATCDAVLCYCGIRLHQIGSLRCPAAFDVVGNATANGTASPTPAAKALERSCRNSSYAGCTRCVQSLQKLKGHDGAGESERERRMLSRDCQLMGLTWLLAKNKTAYIPTVSAVLRAMLYAPHPAGGVGTPRCSPDQENMPLAVNSLQFHRVGRDSASSAQRHGVAGAAAAAAAVIVGVSAARLL